VTVATTRNPRRVLTEAQREAMLARERLVLEERVRGKSFYRIGKDHGIPNPERVWRRATARDENRGFLRAEAVRLEEERLDSLQEGIWDKALAGEPRAVEVALKVLERRARMLGLDFADLVSGQLVEVERARVRVMGEALVRALGAAGQLTEAQRRAVTAEFFAALRADEERRAAEEGRLDHGGRDVVPALEPADEDLL
jgi:hypothetical protein